MITLPRGPVSVIVRGIGAPGPIGAPVASGSLADQTYARASGVQTVDASVVFSGASITYSVAGPAGVTVNPETGLVSIDTDQTYSLRTVTVTAANESGQAQRGFEVTLTGDLAYTPAETQMVTSITVPYTLRDGSSLDVVFPFSKPVQAGQTATGDWFVVKDATANLLAPSPTCRRVESSADPYGQTSGGLDLTGRIIHGLMIDPIDADKQGIDSYTSHSPAKNFVTTHRGVSARKSIPAGTLDFNSDWAPALNMDPAFVMDENTVSNPDHALTEPRGPIALDRAMSLVKGISRAAPPTAGRGGQEGYVVLTVVDEVPAAGAFCPPVPGPAVTLPVTWTEASIEAFLAALPRRTFTHRTLWTPTSHPTEWAKLQRDAKRRWQSWSPRSTQARNITPIWQAGDEPMPYRREIAAYMRRMFDALIADCDPEDKRDILIGLIQAGIDHAAICHVNAADAVLEWPTSGQTSWDVGRSAPTVLALAALPDSEWLRVAWEESTSPAGGTLYRAIPGSMWEDVRTRRVVTATEQFDPPLPLASFKGSHAATNGSWDWLVPDEDLSPAGPVPGMEGHGIDTGRGSRPEGGSFLPSQATDYTGINTTASFDALVPLWLIPGGFTAYGNEGNLRWFDRLYQTDPRPFATLPIEAKWWREIRDDPLLPAFVDKTPNRLMTAPTVEGFGTALLVTVPPHDGDNGSAITDIDLRYRPINLTFRTDSDTGLPTTDVLSESISGLPGWTLIEDIAPNADGQYVVSPEPTGGLLENQYYCVQVRYNNAVGKGPWSRTLRASWSANVWGSNGRMFSGQAYGQTQEALTVAAPVWTAPPPIESFFTEGAMARVTVINPPRDDASYTGFPFPDVSYQWKLDGVDIEGATEREIEIPAGSAGAVLSCTITLTNSEGPATTTVAGETITAAVADTGYAPKIMSASGNVRFTGVDSANRIGPLGTTKTGSFAFIFGGRFGASGFVIETNRLRIKIFTSGRVAISISNGLVGTRGYMEFPGPRADKPHWYLFTINTAEAAEEDRIKLWVREADQPYPAQRIIRDVAQIADATPGAFPFDTLWRFASLSDQQSLFPNDPADQSFLVSDVFAQTGVTLTPADFIAGNGQYIDPATIAAPFLLMGSDMTADDWNEGVNLGSGSNPIPSAAGGGEFAPT